MANIDKIIIPAIDSTDTLFTLRERVNQSFLVLEKITTNIDINSRNDTNNSVSIGTDSLSNEQLISNARNVAVGNRSLNLLSNGQKNIAIGHNAGSLITTGNSNVLLGNYDGNSNGLDISNSSNNIVLSDGDGNIRIRVDSSGKVFLNGNTSISGNLSVTGSITPFTTEKSEKIAVSQFSNNATYPILFGHNISNGFASVGYDTESNFGTYNPSTNTASINISGNAATSSRCTGAASSSLISLKSQYVTVNAANVNNGYKMVFTKPVTINNESFDELYFDGQTGGDQDGTYDPSTNTLKVNISGSAASVLNSKNSTNAQKIKTVEKSDNVNYPLLFGSTDHTEGNRDVFIDSSSGTYNPSTNTASINISGVAASAQRVNLSGGVGSISAESANVLVGRNSYGSGLYSYQAYTDPNAPGPHVSVVGFGRGTDGSAELAISWAGESAAYIRRLRDVTSENWTPWVRLIDSNNIRSQTVNNSELFDGTNSTSFIRRIRHRIHEEDKTSMDQLTGSTEQGFNYGTSSGITGPYITFGGLGADGNYSCQINAQYNGGGTEIAYRTRNDEGGQEIWNPWYRLIHSGNVSNYIPKVSINGNNSGNIFVQYGRAHLKHLPSSGDETIFSLPGVAENRTKTGLIYPPSGYTMSNFRGGIVSLAIVEFSGDVNGDDTLVCDFVPKTNYILIHSGNSEMRGDNHQVTYLFIWSKA